MIRGLLIILSLFAVAMALVIGPIVVIAEVHGKYVCSKFTEVTGLTTKWVTLDTCYVKTDGQFIRYTEYENRAIAQNLKEN